MPYSYQLTVPIIPYRTARYWGSLTFTHDSRVRAVMSPHPQLPVRSRAPAAAHGTRQVDRGRSSSDRRSTSPGHVLFKCSVRYMYYVEPSPALMHPLRLANRPVHGGEEARLRVDGVRAFLSAKSASSICLHVFRRTFSDCYAERADSRRRRDSWIVVRISSRFSIQHHRIGQPLAHTLLRPLPCEAHSRSADVSCVEEVVMKVDND